MALRFSAGKQMKFVKYQALGNDYLVINPDELSRELTPEWIRRLCQRNEGVGADGVLLGPLPAQEADFALRIFNPDGSEAEKSGNGLRIFSRYLWEQGQLKRSPDGTTSEPFTIQTLGGIVRSQVLQGGCLVQVEMGQASFDSRKIPLSGPPRQAVNETMLIQGESLRYCALTLGNPHCVVFCDQTSEAQARRLGPIIENEARFLKRTNVQFLEVVNRKELRIYIWERGTGYTLASGSSSCAAAAAAFRRGLCDGEVTVHNPGGDIQVMISQDLFLTMTGPVARVFHGEWEEEEEC